MRALSSPRLITDHTTHRGILRSIDNTIRLSQFQIRPELSTTVLQMQFGRRRRLASWLAAEVAFALRLGNWRPDHHLFCCEDISKIAFQNLLSMIDKLTKAKGAFGGDLRPSVPSKRTSVKILLMDFFHEVSILVSNCCLGSNHTPSSKPSPSFSRGYLKHESWCYHDSDNDDTRFYCAEIVQVPCSRCFLPPFR